MNDPRVTWIDALTIARNLVYTDIDKAILILEHLHSVNPGHGGCFSSLVMAKLEKKGIRKNPIPVVSCRMLGEWGRFGNQVQQYMTALVFSHMLGFELRVPYWIGSSIFRVGFSENIPDVPVCDRNMLHQIQNSIIRPTNSFDIGTEQAEFGFLWKYRSLLQSRLRSRFCYDAIEELKNADFDPARTIAIHLRGSDSRGTALATNFDSAISEVKRATALYPQSDLIVVTDDEELRLNIQRIVKIKIINTENLQYYNELSFLYDWLILQQSSVVIYNIQSTFSATAVLTSEDSQYRIAV